MQTIRNFMNRIKNDERGLSTVEYVIILVLVAVLGIGVWRTLGNTIKTQVSGADADLNGLREGQAPANE